MVLMSALVLHSILNHRTWALRWNTTHLTRAAPTHAPQNMGFAREDRVFAPERLPATEPLLPAISKQPDVAAHTNARVAQRRKDATAQLMRASAAPVLESLPGEGAFWCPHEGQLEHA